MTFAVLINTFDWSQSLYGILDNHLQLAHFIWNRMCIRTQNRAQKYNDNIQSDYTIR